MPLQSHINTFNKGMNKDYNVLYQPDGTYRHCVNCSLISQDGNNYVIKDCLGNVKTFTINIRYINEDSFDTAPMPIGFISFPDVLIVHSTNDETESGGYGEIGRIDYLPYGEGVSPTIVSGNNNAGYTPLYHHASLNYTKLQQIEGFAFQENEVIKRIYWTDDLNEPRVFDIGNPIYSTYIASGSLITGTQYMVLEGVISHSGTMYGPSIGTGSVSGNIFIASGATYTSVTGTSPTPKVIVYVPYQLLSFTPSRSLGNISFRGYGSGSLYCGNKMYFYRLLSTSQGYNTSWSYGTFPVPVRLSGPGAYFLNVGAGTPTTLVNSGKSVNLLIDNIDTTFDRIQIAVAEFDQLLDVPRQIAIVLDEVITGAIMQFEHSSNINIGTLTLSDLTLFPASILTCKTMTTNKNYMLIGNIKERGEFIFDKSTVTIGRINHPILTHRNANGGSAFSCPNVMTYVPLDYDPFNNPTGANAIQPYTTWLVINASGGSVVYNTVSYGLGQVLTGVPGVFTVTIPAGSQIRACVSRNRYTSTLGVNVLDALVLTSGYWDYKDPTIATQVKGLWDNERYRYGVLLYDLKGNPFYVRHLTDVDINRNFNTDPLTFTETDNDSPILYINQNGVRISGITFSPEIASQISGFSIVRAERDKRVLTQGFLMQSSVSNYVIPPYTVIQPNCSYKSDLDNTGSSIGGYYSLICPDALVQYPIPNFVDGIGLNNTFIEEAYWLNPRTQNESGAARYLKSVTGANDEAETKYFETLPGDANSPRREGIRSQITAPENTDQIGFSNPNMYFANKTETIGLTVDTQCLTGTPNTVHAISNGHVTAGGLRTVLELSDDTILDRANGTVTYASVPNSGLAKMMVDVVVDNANQYGGNSDSALSATTYISTGHFQRIDLIVLADVLDVNGNYTFNNVDVWGGDCFAILADYGYGLFNDAAVSPASPTVPAIGSYSWGIKFPCLCNSNYGLRTGIPSRKIAPDFMHSNSAGNGIFYKIGIKSQLEGFQYNQAYSSDGHFISYPALPLDYILTNVFKYRIRFAGPKFPGELINSFRAFLTNDYKDTDGHGGEINNLRTKDGRTIIWQNSAIDTIPILERQLVSGLDGEETALGTGGVVDRFDPVTSYFGNQHQWGLTATEYGFAWFDMRRKAMVTISFSEGVNEVSKAEGLNGFFNEAFLEVIGNTSPIVNNILNDSLFSKYSDRPLIGVGITGVYDPKFKMTYLTFKFIQRNATTHFNKDFTIGYSHTDKQFIGFYDWTPAISWNHNQIVLSANNPKNKLTYYATGMPSTNFIVCDVVPYGNAEYICISPLTIVSYPGTTTQIPDYPISTFWAKINQTNELWVHNQPKLLGQTIAPDYLYDSFFGQVVSNELQYVVNPKSQNPFSVTNMEQEGNLENFTDIYIQAETQIAQDINIRATSRFFSKIYDKITSNMPFARNGRITNSYLLVRWVKKNWSTNPRVVSTGVKILRLVTSFFESKR
jgi:hypothetical protein